MAIKNHNFGNKGEGHKQMLINYIFAPFHNVNHFEHNSQSRGGRGSDFLDLNQSESFYFWIWVGSGRIRIDSKNLNLLTLS